MDKMVKKLLYIFLLGLSTYAWWKFTSGIKRKMEEIEAE